MRSKKTNRSEAERKATLFSKISSRVVPKEGFWKREDSYLKSIIEIGSEDGDKKQSEGNEEQEAIPKQKSSVVSVEEQKEKPKEIEIKRKETKSVSSQQGGEVLIQRPCIRAFMIVISVLCFLDSFIAIYLAVKVRLSKFWGIGQDAFSFDVRGFLFGGLVAIGATSVFLLISAIALVRNPEALFRFFGCSLSLVSCLILISLGSGAALQTIVLEADLDKFCAGGFPDLSNVAESYLYKFYQVEHDYIQRHMCNRDTCPCSNKIDVELFGERKSEFGDLFISDGFPVSKFHDHCYLDGVAKGYFKALPQDLIDLVRQFEEEKDCQGLCETSLFYFWKTSQYGPPPRSCRQEIVDYFWWECGIIGFFGLVHGLMLFFYFLVQFRFWTVYGQ